MSTASFRAVLLGLMALSLSAQQAPAPPAGAPTNGRLPRPQAHQGPMAFLGLTDAQKQQIRQIRESYHGQTGPGVKREQRFKVLSVLTDDQRQKLFAWEAEHHQERMEHHLDGAIRR